MDSTEVAMPAGFEDVAVVESTDEVAAVGVEVSCGGGATSSNPAGIAASVESMGASAAHGWWGSPGAGRGSGSSLPGADFGYDLFFIYFFRSFLERTGSGLIS